MRHIVLGLGMATMLSACGDPLRDFARLGEIPASNRASVVKQTPTGFDTNQGGLLDRVLERDASDPTFDAVQAAVTNIPAPEPAPRSAEPRGMLGGLFAGMGGGRTEARRVGPDAQDVAPGTTMAFGEIARVCGLRNNELGSQIENDAGFRVYDTAPTSTAPRPFYITGFDDDCARTFTGAVVVTGDVETHEFVRYRPSNERIPYSTTDNAYEALKASECRVGRGQPCGANAAALNRETHFITVYDFFGGTFNSVPTRWAQILVHDGDVMAMSVKGQ